MAVLNGFTADARDVAGPVYNVEAYGAASSLADNTAIIQGVIDLCTSRGAGKVYFPSLYNVACSLKISTNSMTFEGDGPGKSGLTTTSTSPAIKGDGTRHFRFTMRDMVIQGSNASDLLWLNDMDMCYLENILFITASGAGVYVYGATGATRNVFVNCHALGCRYGMYFDTLANSAHVYGGEFQSSSAWGIYIAAAVNNVTVEAVQFEGSTASSGGIYVAGNDCIVNLSRFEIAAQAASGLVMATTACRTTMIGNYWNISGANSTNLSVPAGITYLINNYPAQERFISMDCRTAAGTTADCNQRLGGNQGLTAARNDGFAGAIGLDPAYAGAYKVLRHNYINCENPDLTSNASVGSAFLVRFDAAPDTHLAVNGATTKTTPGAVQAWVKVNIGGVVYYMPAYTSMTA